MSLEDSCTQKLKNLEKSTIALAFAMAICAAVIGWIGWSVRSLGEEQNKHGEWMQEANRSLTVLLDEQLRQTKAIQGIVPADVHKLAKYNQELLIEIHEHVIKGK